MIWSPFISIDSPSSRVCVVYRVQLFTVECQCHVYTFADEPWHQQPTTKKISRGTNSGRDPNVRALRQLFSIHFALSFVRSSNFICQIDGLGRSQNEQCSGDLMACNAAHIPSLWLWLYRNPWAWCRRCAHFCQFFALPFTVCPVIRVHCIHRRAASCNFI